MYYFEIALFVIGIALLVSGYRKNNKNVLLAAAITLFFSAAIGDLTAGFTDGFTANQNKHASIQPQPNNSCMDSPRKHRSSVV